MKTLFENKTKYTKQIYSDFLQFHQKKYGPKYKIYTIVIILLLLFCSILNFSNSLIFTGFIYLIILIGFILYRYFNPIKRINKELKSKQIKNQIEYTFKFYDNCFSVSDGKKTEKNKYIKLYRIFEDNKFFYIYTNKEYAFVLDKNNFVVGNTKDFYNFIKKKIWFRF